MNSIRTEGDWMDWVGSGALTEVGDSTRYRSRTFWVGTSEVETQRKRSFGRKLSHINEEKEP